MKLDFYIELNTSLELYSFFTNYIIQNKGYRNQDEIRFCFKDFSEVSVNTPVLYLEYFEKFKSKIDEIESIKFKLLWNSSISMSEKYSGVSGHFDTFDNLSIFFEIFPNVLHFTKTATFHDKDDRFLNCCSDLSYWKDYKRNVPIYAKLIPVFDFDDKNAKQIDVESLPGHTHGSYLEENLWFGACWQMYFSEIYYKYIPKPLFDSFSDCEENIILENGIRKITLYKNPDDYDLPESRDRQWAFRKHLGIDTIGHETGFGEHPISDDLPVYVTRQSCKNGKTKVTRYLDREQRLINKKAAFFEEIKEYLEDGITIVFEEIKELKKGFFGSFFN